MKPSRTYFQHQLNNLSRNYHLLALEQKRQKRVIEGKLVADITHMMMFITRKKERQHDRALTRTQIIRQNMIINNQTFTRKKSKLYKLA